MWGVRPRGGGGGGRGKGSYFTRIGSIGQVSRQLDSLGWVGFFQQRGSGCRYQPGQWSAKLLRQWCEQALNFPDVGACLNYSCSVFGQHYVANMLQDCFAMRAACAALEGVSIV